MTGLDKWYAYLKSHDRAALWDLLHPDAVFESPVVHTPQRGRDITFKYLVGAEKVLGGEGFKYVGEWRSDNGAVLEFEKEIDGIVINGSARSIGGIAVLMRWFQTGRYVADPARQREVFGDVPTAEDAIARFLRSLGHTVAT